VCILTTFIGRRQMNSPIFPIGTKYGTKKTANYRRDDDFQLTLGYAILPDLYVHGST
jgi:hypothetical protein